MKLSSSFEKIASYKPVKEEVYYHLGISHGKRNNLARAHYNFGLYYKKAGPIQKALFHFQKAHSLSKNNPVLREKIKKESKGLGGDHSENQSRTDPSR